LLLTSAGSSVEYVPDLPSYGRGNDQENDRRRHRDGQQPNPSEEYMERITGVGGVFFRARDPDALARWYAEHLGIDNQLEGSDTIWW
jgi:hypothetical protein